MPKQRLVDFRGGLNKKISPHMIGDTQGQAAKDVDLGSVRLQGRKALDTTGKAQGTFYYEAGNSTTAGRWVSTDSADTSVITNCTDFAVWNKDLYCAINGGDGQIQVFRDGGTSPELLSFDPPSSVEVTTSFPPNTELVAEDDGVEGSDPSYTSTPVTAGNAGSDWGVNSSQYAPVTTSPISYTDTSSGSNSGTWYRWRKSGSTTDYYSRASQVSSGSTTAICARGGVGGTTYPSEPLTTQNAATAGYSYTAGETAAIGSQTYYRWVKGSQTLYATSNSSATTVGIYSLNGGPVTQGPNSSYKWVFTDTRTSTPVDETRNTANDVWEEVFDQKTLEWTTTVRYTKQDGTVQVKTVTSGTSFTADDGFTVTKSSTLAGNIEKLEQLYNRSGTAPFSFWSEVRPLDGSNSYYIGLVEGVSVLSKLDVPSRDEVDNNSGHQIFRGDYQTEIPYNNSTNGAGVEYLHKIPRKIKWKYQIQVTGAVTSGSATLQVTWAGSTKYNQTVTSNPDSITGTDGKTYHRVGSANSSNQWKVKQDNAYTLGTQGTYTPNNTPDAYTYDPISDSLRTAGVDHIPATPAFTRDLARYYIYHAADKDDSSFSKASWEVDQARGSTGGGWLRSGTFRRSISATDEGYFLKTVRKQGDSNGSKFLPVLSQGETQLTLKASNSYSTGNADFLPRRLSFDITAPSDSSSVSSTLPFLTYQLSRVDSFGEANLGYIEPITTITLTESSNTLTLAGLTSTDTYRLTWVAYQGTTLDVAGDHKAKQNTEGIELTNKTSVVLNLFKTDSDRYAVDLWLEKKILTTEASQVNSELWATVRAFEVWNFDATSATITGSDFLDVYPNGVSGSALGASEDETEPPKHLKFLRESNNFFFAVGTDATAPERYVNASANKSDSYLFISQFNNPRNWPINGYLEFDDSITGMHRYPGQMVVWTKSGTYRVFGSAHNQMRKVQLATTEGMPATNSKTAVLVNNLLVWVSASGICVYDGAQVRNLSRARLETWSSMGSGVHAGQYDGQYYVLSKDETGWCVDFNLEGFPMWEVDLREGAAAPAATDPAPVLVYRASTNQLYSRRGIVNLGNRISWKYRSRGFDGGVFGSIKLVRSFTFNGTGSGTVQVYLDGKAVYPAPVSVGILQSSNQTTQPARIYLPAAPSGNQYGLPVADVWDVEIVSWTGQLDWIDTEYDILSGENA